MPDGGRVITGSAGGRRLTAPGRGTRPISDRVKQSLFSALEAERPDVWAAPALDLFAGSGAVGIEALSRGAPAAVLVERDRTAARSIEENLARTHLVERGRVVRGDVMAFLAWGPARVAEAPFGSVVLDPPYAEVELLGLAVTQLGVPGWLDDGAIVVAKHFWRDGPPEAVTGLVRIRQRRFGETALTMYRRAAPLAPGGGT